MEWWSDEMEGRRPRRPKWSNEEPPRPSAPPFEEVILCLTSSEILRVLREH